MQDCLKTDVAESKNWLLWEKVSTSVLANCKIFTVKKSISTSKCGLRKEGSFFTLDCGAWVNVIAITDDREVIMVEQYRHGVEDLTMEIPGGCIESTDADPLAAAIREFREETGCVAERWSFLGKVHPNPAMQNNLCHTYLAEGVTQLESPRFDNTGTERLLNRSIPLRQIDDSIRTGIITHSLVITAFHYLALARPELLQSPL